MPSIWRKFLQYKNFPIPRSGFSKNYLTLKITPTPETKLAVTKQFFRAIKTVSLPIILELIATSKTIFYQLSSAPQDQELLTRQLKTFFPEFIIEPVTVNRNQFYPEQPALPAPETSAETTSQSLVLATETELDYLFSLNLYPASTWNLFSTAKEFSVDPYHQLFNLLDGVGTRDIIVIQFVIMPISEQGMRGVMGEIAGIAGDPSAYNQWEEAINEKEYDNFNEGIYSYTKPGKVELVTTRSEQEVFDFSKEIEEADGDIRYYKTRKRQASRDGDRDLADAYQEDLEEARKRLRQYPEPTVINNYHYGTFKTLMPGVEKSVKEYLEGLSSKTPASLLGINMIYYLSLLLYWCVSFYGESIKILSNGNKSLKMYRCL
ncbi:MAG: hypothetical protein FD167_1454 [bacterium]|nr:MAG: hypothetical protein FD167_1454 [bacterium]